MDFFNYIKYDILEKYRNPLLGRSELFGTNLGNATSNLIVSDEFISLAHKIDKKNKNNKVLLITSLKAGEGKTTVSANLAIALAHIGKKVLLMDADFKRPALHGVFNLNPLYGLSEILAKDIRVESFIPKDSSPNEVHLITSGKKLYSEDQFPKSKLRALLLSLRKHYDYVLLDSAPLTVKGQFKKLLQIVDGVYLVVRNDNLLFFKSSTLQKLPRTNKKFQGLIINNYHSNLNQLVFN